MLNKLNVLLLFAFIFLQFEVNAQTLNSKANILRQPTEYEHPNGDISAPTHPSKNTSWIIFSDRDNNRTFKGPDENSGQMAVVNFLDAFYAIEEKGDFIHLVEYNQRMIDEGNSKRLKKEAIDKGWIKKDKLVLWTHSLVNDKRFERKALPIIKDESGMKNPSAYIKTGGKLKIFNSPALDNENEKEVRMFQFLYVFKEIDDKCLIAKADFVNTLNVHDRILGWVDKKIIQPWESRVCLEPNQSEEAVAERKDKNIKTTLLLSRENADNFRSTGSNTGKVWDDDPFDKPLKPDWKRLPILSNDPSAKTVETGYITDIIDKNTNQSVVNLDEQATANKNFEIQRDNIRQVKIVFVVDGGDNMAEYFPSVINAIDKVVNYQFNSSSSNVLKYGAVVYRDYSDVNCPDGDKSVKKSNITSNYTEVVDFLKREKDIHSCNDQEKTQAVNLGLKTALKMLSNLNKPDQSNFIVLIGGVANPDNDTKVPNSEIEKMLVDVRANVLAFQTNNGNGAEYRNFVTSLFARLQVENYNLFMQLKNDSKISSDRNVPQPVMKRYDRVAKFLNSTSTVMGEIMYPTIGSPLPTEMLVSEMDSMIEITQKDIERKINTIAEKYEGIGDKKIDNSKLIDPSILIYFHSLGMQLPDQNLIKQYMKDNYQFFIKCYASPECDKLSNPVFSRVLFVNEFEMAELKRQFRNLSAETGDANSLRTALFNTFNQILITYLGEKEAKASLTTKSQEEVIGMLTGIRKNKGVLSKYTIKDILDSKKVSKEDLQEIQGIFEKKGNKLSEISNDPNYKLKSNDEWFYWVPEDALP